MLSVSPATIAATASRQRRALARKTLIRNDLLDSGRGGGDVPGGQESRKAADQHDQQDKDEYDEGPLQGSIKAWMGVEGHGLGRRRTPLLILRGGASFL